MYVANSLNSLNYYPHQVHFETVRDVDNIRRHSWSPGYYEDEEGSLDHHLASPEDGTPEAMPVTPLEATDGNTAIDGELSAVPA